MVKNAYQSRYKYADSVSSPDQAESQALPRLSVQGYLQVLEDVHLLSPLVMKHNLRGQIQNSSLSNVNENRVEIEIQP